MKSLSLPSHWDKTFEIHIPLRTPPHDCLRPAGGGAEGRGGNRLFKRRTYKQIIDLRNWDDSRVLNAPGQSGQPGSPYYDSLLDEWKNGDYLPYLFTREAVNENAVHTLRLVPGG